MTPALALRVMEANARSYRRVWKGSIVTTFVNPVLFLAAMGLGLGTLVDRQPGSALGDLPYISFIAPGLLAAAAMQTGSSEGSWPVFAGIKWIKTYHATLATPVGTPELLAGTLLWIGVRLSITCVLFVTVTWMFDAVPLGGGIAAIPAALLTGMAFAVPNLAYTTSIESETRLVAVYRFVITPMFLFSGAFFPVEQLPDWLEPVAIATPLWHGVELCRAAALGIATEFPPGLHIAYLVAWAIPGWWVAKRGLERKLKP